MSRLHSQIEHLAQQFAQSVLQAVREASLDDLLGETRSRGGRPARAAASPGAARAPRGKGKRVRRSSEQLEKTVEHIVSLLKKNKNGLRSEQIQAALGLTRREIPRPLQLGLSKKVLRKKGQKRSTVYYAA